jgi:uncharacterized protein (UPF0332 family)
VTEENRRAATSSEWERAEEALSEAEILRGAGKPGGAVSRAYYGAFHAARALLFAVGLQPRSHAGVRSMIGLHFVRTGRMAPPLAHALSHVARAREDADYDAAAVFTGEDADEAIARAREFIAAVRTMLEAEGWLG